MAGDGPVAQRSRTAIVTGATSGIGKELTWDLCQKGYTVVLACRSVQRAHEVRQRIIDSGTCGSPVVIAPLDLGSMESIKAFVSAFQRSHPRLDILVNNAGCNFVSDWRTEHGVPGIVQVNFLGPFFLTRLLEGQMLQNKARVVNVSSVMHRLSVIPSSQEFLTSYRAGTYANTKLANVMFSQALYTRSDGKIQAASVDPGGVSTRIYRGAPFISRIVQMACRFGIMATPREGCQAVIAAATQSWPASYTLGTEPCAEHIGEATALKAPFFARGLFASPLITVGGSNAIVARVVRGAFGPFIALLDQPVRWLFCGSFGTGRTFVVPANVQVFDNTVVDALWDASCRLCDRSDHYAGKQPPGSAVQGPDFIVGRGMW